MSEYKIEKELDELLKFLVNYGTNRVIQIQEITAQFPNYNLSKMLPVLEHMALVIPFVFDFNDGKSPTKFPYLFQVTPAAIHFVQNSSFVEIAKQQQKEQRRFNFEYFTMGWDTVIAFISLVMSIISLFIATK